MLAAMIVATACTTDDEPTEITGRYGNLTGESDTVITIGKTSDGYSFQCVLTKYFQKAEQTTTTYGTEPLKILHRM